MEDRATSRPGERNAEIEMHVAANSYSSSMLPMLPMHLAGAPQSAYVGSEPAPMRTLDSLIGTVIRTPTKDILQIDVQYEAWVLAGAERVCSEPLDFKWRCRWRLYEGQASFANY
jgi:hypothetical protein